MVQPREEKTTNMFLPRHSYLCLDFHEGAVNLTSKTLWILHSAQPMKLFPPPLHLCLDIILKCQSAFPLTLRLPFSSTLSHTHTGTGGLHRKSTVCFLYLFHTGISTHTIDTYTQTHTHTRDGHTHAHNQNKRVRERPQTPKQY